MEEWEDGKQAAYSLEITIIVKDRICGENTAINGFFSWTENMQTPAFLYCFHHTQTAPQLEI